MSSYDPNVLKLIAIEDRLGELDREVRSRWAALAHELKIEDENPVLYKAMQQGVRFCKRGHAREDTKGRCPRCHCMTNMAAYRRRREPLIEAERDRTLKAS